MTQEIAYGRVGFLGNPSDMYGGKTISFSVADFATVNLVDSLGFEIIGKNIKENKLNIENSDSFGDNNLMKATISYLGLENVLRERGTRIFYDSDIPVGAGLSGSSAIIVAAIRAFNRHLKLGLDDYRDIAEKALHVETDVLGISAGFQDRYIISYARNDRTLAYMDFKGKELIRPSPSEEPYGKLEQLSVDFIPCYLLVGTEPKSSAITHNPLRKEFLEGYSENADVDSRAKSDSIKSEMDMIAELAEMGKEYLLSGDWIKLGRLMNINHELRGNLLGHRKKDAQMVQYALDSGALGAKVAGSGGSVVVLSDDPSVKEVIEQKYACLVPKIGKKNSK